MGVPRPVQGCSRSQPAWARCCARSDRSPRSWVHRRAAQRRRAVLHRTRGHHTAARLMMAAAARVGRPAHRGQPVRVTLGAHQRCCGRLESRPECDSEPAACPHARRGRHGRSPGPGGGVQRRCLGVRVVIRLLCHGQCDHERDTADEQGERHAEHRDPQRSPIHSQGDAREEQHRGEEDRGEDVLVVVALGRGPLLVQLVGGVVKRRAAGQVGEAGTRACRAVLEPLVGW